jgi:5-methylcytosine-specific restriction enzyme subunit McrC
MERLYELFVAEWLKVHLPPSVVLSIQEKVDVGEDQALTFRIDLVLYDATTGESLCVLDTKYKAKERPDTNDVAKVVVYAEMKNCDKAVLIYPQPLAIPLNELFGKISLKSMTFSLAGDLEYAGQFFLNSLIENGIIKS